MAENTEPAEDEAKGGKKKLIIIVVVVLLLAGGAGAFFTGAFDKSESQGEETTEESAGNLPAQYIPFKPDFVSNYRIDGRARYMKVVVAAMTREDEARLAIDLHMPVLRNQLVMLFGAADYDALKTTEGVEALRAEALLATQEVLQKEIGKPGIEQILFTDFVLQ